MVREEILARLNGLTRKTEAELRSLMQEAGTAALQSDDEVYKRQGLTPSPIRASEDLRKVLQAGYDRTKGTFRNLTMTTAKTATRQFEQALDRAYMQITMGGMSYNTAVRRAVKDLSATGVWAAQYPSGKTDSLEAAVRRAVITGANQTALRLQETRADEMGADLVEVSAPCGSKTGTRKMAGRHLQPQRKKQKVSGFQENNRLRYRSRTWRLELFA